MLAILCSWIIIAVVFLAFGEMLVYVWNKVMKKDILFSFFDTFWLGLCTVGMLVCIITLFLPINIYVLSAFIFTSVVYWIFNLQKGKNLLNRIVKGFKSFSLLNKIGLASFLIIVLIYTLTIPYINTVYDIGLYHLQSLMWTEQYSVVPGLGNLHGRLAFNSNSLLFHALFSYHPNYYLTFFPFAGLCIFVLCSWVIKKIDGQNRNIQTIVLYLILLIFIFVVRHAIQTTSTDLLASIFVLYIILKIALSEKNAGEVFTISVMAVFCITLKLSSAPILLATLWGFFYFIRKKEYKPVWSIIVLGTLFIIPWCTRFVILSGYLVYPYPDIDIFSFDWKMPIEAVVTEKNAVYSWARMRSTDYATVSAMSWYQWIPTWISQQEKSAVFLFAASFISCLPVLISIRTMRNHAAYFIAWGIAFCGSLFTFFSAPDIRFGAGFVLCAIFLSLLILFVSFKTLYSIDKNLKYIGIGAIFVSVFYIAMPVRQMAYYRDPAVSSFTFLVEPQTIDYARKGKKVQCVERKVGDIIIYTSDKWDQCFDLCFPCAPFYLDYNNLELRGKSLQDGFRVKE